MTLKRSEAHFPPLSNLSFRITKFILTVKPLEVLKSSFDTVNDYMTISTRNHLVNDNEISIFIFNYKEIRM